MQSRKSVAVNMSSRRCLSGERESGSSHDRESVDHVTQSKGHTIRKHGMHSCSSLPSSPRYTGTDGEQDPLRTSLCLSKHPCSTVTSGDRNNGEKGMRDEEDDGTTSLNDCEGLTECACRFAAVSHISSRPPVVVSPAARRRRRRAPQNIADTRSQRERG